MEGWNLMEEKNTEVKTNTENGKGRMANMELLRCVSMLMVVVLHFLGKGGALVGLATSDMPAYGRLAWLIDAFAIVAVNVYMLISGYFLVESSFQLKRVLQLLLQLWFYSIGVGAVAALFGYFPEEGFGIHYLLMLCFPVSMEHYWFMTAYIFMYLLMPLLSAGVKKLEKKQFQMVLCFLLVTFSGVKSVVPAVLETDGRGYDCLWYVCVFLVAAYIRLYGIPFFKNKARGAIVYIVSVAGIFGVTMLFCMLYFKTGKFVSILGNCYHYNHVLVLAASVGLFYLFYHMKIKQGVAATVICKIAPYTLGVYLWHEHIAIRYEWHQWIYGIFGELTGVASLLGLLLVSVIFVFATGILLDFFRKLLFGLMHRILSHLSCYRKLCGFVETLSIKK